MTLHSHELPLRSALADRCAARLRFGARCGTAVPGAGCRADAGAELEEGDAGSVALREELPMVVELLMISHG